MNLLSKSTILIFLGVLLQSFCSLGLIFFKPITANFSGTFNSISSTSFASSWIILTFFSRILGAYTLGKYCEENDFLKTQKILVCSYVATSILFCSFCFGFSHLYNAKHLALLIANLSIFLFPATLVIPTIYLMRTLNHSLHMNIGTLIISATVVGHGASYYVFHYLAKGSLKVMSVIFIFSSFLCFSIYQLGKEFWSVKKTITKEKTLKPSTTLEKILAVLIGSVSGAGLTHHFFFLRPYRQDILIVDGSIYEYLYLFFYAAVILCLATFYLLRLNTDKLKLMAISVASLLTLAFSFNVFCQNNEILYFVYQFSFALALSGFLAPALGFVFSLFKTDQPFFNSLFYFYSGVSLSFLISFLLNNQFGPFHHHFLFISPLIFSGMLFLALCAFLYKKLVPSILFFIVFSLINGNLNS